MQILPPLPETKRPGGRGASAAKGSWVLGAAASVPVLSPLRRHWATAVSDAITAAAPRFVLDLRSEAYVAIGPVPDEIPGVYVRVVTESGRELNHLNKHAKGLLVRTLAESRPRAATPRVPGLGERGRTGGARDVRSAGDRARDHRRRRVTS